MLAYFSPLILLWLTLSSGAAFASPRSAVRRVQESETQGLVELVRSMIDDNDRAGARALLANAVESLGEPPSGAEEAYVASLLELDRLAKSLGSLEASLVLQEAIVSVQAKRLPPEHPNLLKAKQGLAAARFRLGDVSGAHELFQEVLEIWTRILPANDPDLLRARGNLAVARRALGDLAGAHALFEQSLAAWITIAPPDDPDLIMAKQNLAATKFDMGDVMGARELCEEVLATRERILPPDHSDLLAAKQNLAVIRKELGDLTGARQLEEETLAAQVRLLPAEHPDLLRAKAHLAVTRKELGDLQGAFELEDEVLSARTRFLPADHPDLLAAKQNFAVTLRELGDLEGALELEEEVLAIQTRRLPGDHPDLLAAKENLAVTRKNLGDLAGAQDLEEEVLSTRSRALAADHADVLRVKGNLAVTRKTLGDFVGAQELEEEVLMARTRALPPAHPDLLEAKSNLANTRFALGDLAGARELEEEVLATRVQFLPGDRNGLLNAKQNLALTRAKLGDLDGAGELFEELLTTRAQLLPEDDAGLAIAKQNLAVTRRQLGDIAGAHELFKEVLVAWSGIVPSGHPDLLTAEQNLAVTSKELGDLDGARRLLSELLGGIRERAGDLLQEAGRSAREGCRAELQRLSTILFLASTVDPGHELQPELLATIETLRSVSVASHAVAQALAARPELAEEAREIADIRAQLNDLVAAGPEAATAGDWRKQLLSLTEERDRRERRLRHELAERGTATDGIDARAIAVRLGDGAAAATFLRYAKRLDRGPGTEAASSVDSLLAFLVKRDGSVTLIDLGPAADLETLVAAWRALLGRPLVTRGIASQPADEKGGLEGLGEQLRQRLLDPILAVAGDVRTLHVIPDDVLYLLPLDALPRGEGLVGDSLAIHNEVTLARLLQDAPPVSADGRLVLAGGLDYDASSGEGGSPPMDVSQPPLPSREGAMPTSFEALPGTSGEVEAIARLHDEVFAAEARSLTRGGGTKAALFSAAPSARWLHLATHGWFASESFRSQLDTVAEQGTRDAWLRAEETLTGFAPETLCGLALAGANGGKDSLGRVPGILTAEELASFDLRNCELAVLSACETNVGIRRAGQGIQSLQTALHAAGARTAITSLWKVDDAATRRLFELFYAKLWKEKLGKADALWQAKMALRAEGHPPRDWAAWVLSGDPD